MSVLWHHNPDRVSTATASQFWTTVHADVTVTASGYDGTQGYTASSANGVLTLLPGGMFPTPTDTASFRFGGRFLVSALPAAAKVLLAALDPAGVIQVCVSLNVDGTVTIWRGNMATALVTSAQAVTVGTHFKLGFKGTINPVSGSAEVHLNSTAAAPNIAAQISGANTVSASSSFLTWAGLQVGVTTVITAGHLYVIDGSGSVNNLVHGYRVAALAPTGASNHSEWTAVGAATIWEALDDAAPDGDSTYASETTDDERFSVTTADLTATNTSAIYGVQVTNVVRNVAGGGTPSHIPFVYLDDDNEYFGALMPVTTSYAAVRAMFGPHPLTGTPWTRAQVLAANPGGRMIA